MYALSSKKLGTFYICDSFIKAKLAQLAFAIKYKDFSVTIKSIL